NKLLLKTRGRTILEHVILGLIQGGVHHVVVIVGPRAKELVLIAREAKADVCALPHATPNMRATVEFGLNWIEQRFQPQPDDAWLITPADLPLIDSNVVRRLCEQFVSNTTRSIIIPTYQGKRGHPALFGWHEIGQIRAYPAEMGLNSYVRA